MGSWGENYNGLLNCLVCMLHLNMWMAGALILGAVVYAIWTFNRLVGLRNQWCEAWSGVEVQLKRRHDLIPNLMACVQGYRTHEQGVLHPHCPRTGCRPISPRGAWGERGGKRAHAKSPAAFRGGRGVSGLEGG